MTVGATLSARQAAARPWDIAVVGAGPAGSWLARRVADAGLRCLLLDRRRFPRPKVCGGCLSARTVNELGETGIAAELLARGAPRLEQVRLSGWRRTVELPLPPGIAVSRQLLDALLLGEALGRGAEFLPGYRVALEEPANAAGRRLRLGDERGATVEASVVVDATGLGGSLLGADTAPRRAGRRSGGRIGCSAVLRGGDGPAPGTVSMSVGRQGYVGAVLLEDDRLNVAAALDRAAVQRLGLAEAVRRILWQAGGPQPRRLSDADWSATPALTQRPATRARSRLFAVGDAAGYVEPFTGEGIGWALRSATLLAPIAIAAARRWSEELTDAWNTIYRGELVRRQRGCRALSWLLRHPAPARCAFAALRRRPQLGSPVIRRFHGVALAAPGRGA